jgi:hypothetical protein
MTQRRGCRSYSTVIHTLIYRSRGGRQNIPDTVTITDAPCASVSRGACVVSDVRSIWYSCLL